MKKIFITTLVLILVPTLIFVPVYALLIYTYTTNIKDYSDDVLGRWDAYQYYYDNERVACNENTWMSIDIGNDYIIIDGTILPKTDSTYSWSSGTSFNFDTNGETTTFFLSFDAQNNLKIIVDDSNYIIMLRKNVR